VLYVNLVCVSLVDTDLYCVEWDVKPYSTQLNSTQLVDTVRCHLRGFVPCVNLQLLIYELVCLVMTAELMTLQINKIA